MEEKETQELQTIENQELSMAPEDIQERLIQDIISCRTQEDLDKYLSLFNFAQTKNNALRAIKYTKLREKLDDQIIERVDKRPDQMSNKDLMDLVQLVSNQMDKNTSSGPDKIISKPVIQIQKNDINLDSGLDRDSKEKVMDFVSNFLKQAALKSEEPKENDEIIVVNDEKDTTSNESVNKT